MEQRKSDVEDLLTKIVKLPTLENTEIRINTEDAICISFESATVAAIFTGKFNEEDYWDKRFGGKAINLAIQYCEKFGKIKANILLPSNCSSKLISDAINNFDFLLSYPEFEMKCKEPDVKAWVDDFIDRIIKNGAGMVHELLAVSKFLSAFRLSDLVSQYIFDSLTFKHYREFRKTFGISFLSPPYYSNRDPWNICDVFEDLFQLPTVKDICDKFNVEFPFTPDELITAELENKSVRVGGNLEYNNEDWLIREIFIKIEYLVRRLNSLWCLSIWLMNALSKCETKCVYLFKKFYGNESNNDIDELRRTFSGRASELRQEIFDLNDDAEEKIANSFKNYKDIELINDDINNIEFKTAVAANTLKAKIVEQAKHWQTNWENDNLQHKDRVLPHLTYLVENHYHEIYCLLFTMRAWTSPQEVQDNFRKFNVCNEKNLQYTGDQNEEQSEDVENVKQNGDHQTDVESEEQNGDHGADVESEEQNEDHRAVVENEEQNEDHGEDVESEEQNEDHQVDVEREELADQKSVADDKIRDAIVSSLTTLQCLVENTCHDIRPTYKCFLNLQRAMQHLLHLDLLLKDEEMLTFVCNEKLKLYRMASKQRIGSNISYAKQFDRIRKDTNKKFGGRDPVIEKAKEKYFLHFEKFCNAMDDETKCQKVLLLECGKESIKQKHATGRKRKKTLLSSTNILNVHA